jgi:4-hydroxy-tetrahydrodipicolinate synthase
LVPCGTTGESVTLTESEHQRVIEAVIEQTAGRVPVIAGVGSNNTATSIERARHASHAGADGLLVVVPYYNKPTQAGMIAHFMAVAEASETPVALYNVPGRTGVNMTPQTILALADHPNIVSVKEASGSLDAATEILASAPPDFTLLSGDDSLTVPIMAIGGTGVISVASNVIPRDVSDLVAAAMGGRFAEARQMHLRLYDFFRAMFIENNPTAVKTAAALFELCSDELRLPLTEISPSGRQEIARAIAPWLPRRAVAA